MATLLNLEPGTSRNPSFGPLEMEDSLPDTTGSDSSYPTRSFRRELAGKQPVYSPVDDENLYDWEGDDELDRIQLEQVLLASAAEDTHRIRAEREAQIYAAAILESELQTQQDEAWQREQYAVTQDFKKHINASGLIKAQESIAQIDSTEKGRLLWSEGGNDQDTQDEEEFEHKMMELAFKLSLEEAKTREILDRFRGLPTLNNSMESQSSQFSPMALIKPVPPPLPLPFEMLPPSPSPSRNSQHSSPPSLRIRTDFPLLPPHPSTLGNQSPKSLDSPGATTLINSQYESPQRTPVDLSSHVKKQHDPADFKVVQRQFVIANPDISPTGSFIAHRRGSSVSFTSDGTTSDVHPDIKAMYQDPIEYYRDSMSLSQKEVLHERRPVSEIDAVKEDLMTPTNSGSAQFDEPLYSRQPFEEERHRVSRISDVYTIQAATVTINDDDESDCRRNSTSTRFSRQMPRGPTLTWGSDDGDFEITRKYLSLTPSIGRFSFISDSDKSLFGEGTRFGFPSLCDRMHECEGDGLHSSQVFPTKIPLTANRSDFCLEAYTWVELLRYIMWYGESRVIIATELGDRNRGEANLTLAFRKNSKKISVLRLVISLLSSTHPQQTDFALSSISSGRAWATFTLPDTSMLPMTMSQVAMSLNTYRHLADIAFATRPNGNAKTSVQNSSYQSMRLLSNSIQALANEHESLDTRSSEVRKQDADRLISKFKYKLKSIGTNTPKRNVLTKRSLYLGGDRKMQRRE